MKKLFYFFLIVLSATSIQAQIPGQDQGNIHPVDWSGSVEKKSGDSFDLVFKAEIKDGWHIFSQFTAKGGSIPMKIKYVDKGDGYKTEGKTKESKTKTQYNDVFEVDETIFEHKAVLTQTISKTNPDRRYVKAEMSYQVCQESCINEEYYFVFDLQKGTVKIFENYDKFQNFGEKNGEGGDQKSASSDQMSSGAGSAMSGASTEQDGMKSPVSWKGDVKEESDKKFDLVFKGDIKEGWHIFSQFTAEGGSLPMKIEFLDEGDDYVTNGKAEESKTKTQYNDVFDVDETIFEDQAIVTQNITLNDSDVRYIKAQMSYQVCQESCINQEYYFVFDLKDKSATVFSNYDKFKNFKQNGSDKSVKEEVKEGNKEIAEGTEKADSGQDRSLSVIFILAFLWGFAALLTPCVFPMIPMTVSFFIKQSKTKAKGRRNALLYSFFIIVIYVILGSLVTAIFGADALNALSTNVIFNIVFFVILVFFAVSFLGAFEIVLPSSWTNKVDKQADRGGIIGIFFMALALAIVSFSCTGPIIGTLLVQASSQGGFLGPIVGMFAFSLALAIPFGLFAMFPSWMNAMPKSGGWLNAVKVVLGLLELAFAFKFLSNADLVLQAHILPREIFLAIWIAIFGMMAFYLFGKIQLPNDSKIQNISVGRFGLGLIVLSFVIYLIPGIWGAPLKLISGFPPPMTYSESPDGVGYTKTATVSASGDQNDIISAGAEPGPHDIMVFKDYDEGIDYAKKVNKPVMLDFTGMACVNCRKMEERVWSDPEILSILKNDVVLISLYVDLKEELPEDEQYTSETTGKRIRTVGNKWSDFQIKNYQVNAQPYYVLISPDTEENLAKAVGYEPDVPDYKAWLQKGIKTYKKEK